VICKTKRRFPSPGGGDIYYRQRVAKRPVPYNLFLFARLMATDAHMLITATFLWARSFGSCAVLLPRRGIEPWPQFSHFTNGQSPSESLCSGDLALLEPHLQPVDLPVVHRDLEKPNTRIKDVFFN
jgi:hypothetical protein